MCIHARRMAEESGFAYCRVCRQSHPRGRKHVYTPSHQRRLTETLNRQLQPVNDVRFFFNNVTRVAGEEQCALIVE